ncbi:MAG: hypothetical protein ACR2N3_13300 [Pyrinomonadaceae bacterium]
MQTNLEQIKQVVLQLPAEEFEKFDEWYEAEKRNKSKGAAKENLKKHQVERYRKARKWLDEHAAEYMNQWVCLEGDKLIAHGSDALQVHRAAKQAGIVTPFVHHIVPEVDMGSW